MSHPALWCWYSRGLGHSFLGAQTVKLPDCGLLQTPTQVRLPLRASTPIPVDNRQSLPVARDQDTAVRPLIPLRPLPHLLRTILQPRRTIWKTLGMTNARFPSCYWTVHRAKKAEMQSVWLGMDERHRRLA